MTAQRPKVGSAAAVGSQNEEPERQVQAGTDVLEPLTCRVWVFGLLSKHGPQLRVSE